MTLGVPGTFLAVMCSCSFVVFAVELRSPRRTGLAAWAAVGRSSATAMTVRRRRIARMVRPGCDPGTPRRSRVREAQGRGSGAGAGRSAGDGTTSRIDSLPVKEHHEAVDAEAEPAGRGHPVGERLDVVEVASLALDLLRLLVEPRLLHSRLVDLP